jgi:hypothetical protein
MSERAIYGCGGDPIDDDSADCLVSLPERFDVVTRSTGPVQVWTAEQMRAYAAECVRAERERHADDLRCALEALDYCLEDSAELLSERAAQWGQYRRDRQAAMAATLERHKMVADRLRRALRPNAELTDQEGA